MKLFPGCCKAHTDTKLTKVDEIYGRFHICPKCGTNNSYEVELPDRYWGAPYYQEGNISKHMMRCVDCSFEWSNVWNLNTLIAVEPPPATPPANPA
jgi:C4-type Zn-finger protein